MASKLNNNQITGIILIVLGALALAGFVSSAVVLAAGIIALVYGIMILLKAVPGSPLLGVICLVAGLLLLFGYLPFIGALVGLLTTIIGVILIVVGVLKLLGKM